MKPETLIIGAGVIGLSIARELHRRGERDIMVLDRGKAGREASWAAAGMLSPQAEAHSDDDFFRFCLEARSIYRTFAEELLFETGVDVELDRSGTIAVAFDEKDSEELDERLEWQRRVGLEVSRLTEAELREMELGISGTVRSALFFPDDWQVENRKLVEALIEYSRVNGVKIAEDTEVRNLLVDSDRAVGVTTGEGNIHCERIILTAGAWTSLIEGAPFTVKPIRGQMVCFRPDSSLLKHIVSGPNGYLVPRRDGRLLAGATVEDAGFNKSVTDDALKSLRSMALEIVPSLGNVEINESWSGLRPFVADGIPVLGSVPGVEGVSVATAHYRNGILLAPLTARIIVDELLEGHRAKFLDAFGATRFLHRSASTM